MKFAWYEAILKAPFLEYPPYTKVRVLKTSLAHTSLGTTFWVLFPEEGEIYHVAETLAGKEGKSLFKYLGISDKQKTSTTRADKLLKGSQYREGHIHEIRKLVRKSKKLHA